MADRPDPPAVWKQCLLMICPFPTPSHDRRYRTILLETTEFDTFSPALNKTFKYFSD